MIACIGCGPMWLVPNQVIHGYIFGAPRCEAVAWRSTKSGQTARKLGKPAMKFLKHRVMRVAASDGSVSGAMDAAVPVIRRN